MEEENQKIADSQENQQIPVEEKKKKKKKPKNKKKKTVEEQPVAQKAKEEPEKNEENDNNIDNHEDLLKLLSQNDNSQYEKLLNITPDFTKFDEIKIKFEAQIKHMNNMMDDIFAGKFEKIPDEEENYGYKTLPDDKQLDPQRKKTLNEFKEKINFFEERIKKLEQMEKLPNDELSNDDRDMINSIKRNLSDDIKRAEDFMVLIANTDSYVLKH